jgi:dipeptidyl-peptidase-3
MALTQLHLPDPASPVHRLNVKSVFDVLSPRDKLYAHHLFKAAWAGTRIILRQTSRESEIIFDFIIALYHVCDGKWSVFAERCGITEAELAAFLSYPGLFLYNLGNFYMS